MAPTLDNVNTIQQFAAKLEKWANSLSCSTSPTKNFWVELTLLFYPQDLEATVSRLASIPAVGPKVQKNFEELSEIVHKLDAWRAQRVYEEELGRFGTLTDRLRDLGLNMVQTLREASGADTSEPPVAEEVTAAKSKTSEVQQTNPTGIEPDCVPTASPRKEALMAYKLYHEMGLTRPQVAKRIRSELMLEKPVRHWEVARWIRQVENWRTRTGLPAESVLERLSTLGANDLADK